LKLLDYLDGLHLCFRIQDLKKSFSRCGKIKHYHTQYEYVYLNTKTRNFYIWQLLLYLLLKLTQIYSAAAWSWIVQHIFQIILFNFVSGDLYRFCKLDILLKIALKHSTGTQNHVSKSNQIRLEGSLVLMQYGISQTFLKI
jgi:hypothetical protein